MALQAAIFTNFAGGIASGIKSGVKGAGAFLQAFDFRTDPNTLSVLPGLAREDAGVVKDLILQEEMASNGVIYATGDAGYIYRRATTGVWSEFGTLGSGSAGMDYRLDSDAIYVASNKTVSLISGVVNGTPTLTIDKYASSISTYNNSDTVGFNVNADQEGSTQTTQIVGTLSEDATKKRYFQTDIEPCNKISVYVTDKSVDDFTMVLHDGTDKELARATITNANLKNNDWNDFVFSGAPNGQVRLYPAPNARTYHIHMFSSVGDGAIRSSAVNDLSTCDLRVYADRLIQSQNGWHPMERFLQYELIGNANYISAWEPLSDPPTNAEWLRHQLTVPMEYECCGIATTNEYMIAAFEKNSSASGSTPQEGLLIFWDGLSPTYNYFLPITEGSPHALHVYANVAYYHAAGAWWAVTSPVTQPVRLRTLPSAVTDYAGTNSPIRVYPYAATTRRGIQLMGWPGSTTATGPKFGVYSWGAIDKNYPTVLGYNYVMSTGSQTYGGGNNLKIGMVKSFGDLLHVSWRDDLNGGYGIDKVDNTSTPAGTAIYQTLVVDGGNAGKPKDGKWVEAYFNLPAGSSIQLAYQFNRSGTWNLDPNIYSSVNLWQGRTGYARFNIPGNNSRFYEAQVQIVVTSNGNTTPPQPFEVGFYFDNLKENVGGV